jgi:hypothetical protein
MIPTVNNINNNEKWQSIINTSLQAVVQIFEQKFHGQPPIHGKREFKIISSNEQFPRAITNSLFENLKEYSIAIPNLYSVQRPNQLVYQLAHECTHFWCDPIIEHPLMEVICVGISLSILTELNNMFPNWKMSLYRERIEHNVGFFGKETDTNSVKQKLVEILHNNEQFKSTMVNDTHIFAGAVLARYVLDECEDWRPLLCIRNHLQYSMKNANNNNNDEIVLQPISSMNENDSTSLLCPEIINIHNWHNQVILSKDYDKKLVDLFEQYFNKNDFKSNQPSEEFSSAMNNNNNNNRYFSCMDRLFSKLKDYCLV